MSPGDHHHSVQPPVTTWERVLHSHVSPSFKRNSKSGLFFLFKLGAGQPFQRGLQARFGSKAVNL